MKNIKRILVSLFVSACFQAFPQGNLAVNGCFNTDASGWLATNIAAGAGYDPFKGNPGGTFWLESTSPSLTPSIWQTVAGLTPGQEYLISGDYSLAGGPASALPSFAVSVNGGVVFQVAPVDYGWHTFNAYYLAAAPGAIVSLSAEINGLNDSFRVDNVAMTPTPEPSAVVFAALLIVALPVIFRRKVFI